MTSATAIPRDTRLLPTTGISTPELDPFNLTPAASSARHRYSSFDTNLFASHNLVSPDQSKPNSGVHIPETNQGTPDNFQRGPATLNRKSPTQVRLSRTESGRAAGDMALELSEKLAELEKVHGDLGKETARQFVPRKPRRSNGLGDAATDESVFTSNSRPSPSKPSLGSPRKHNAGPSTHLQDIEFATEISASLLSQVRALQSTLAEKEEALRRANADKETTQADANILVLKLRDLDHQEQRIKDENWQLELQNQRLVAEVKDAASREQRLNHNINVARTNQSSAEKDFEDLREDHDKLKDDYETLRQQLDTDLKEMHRSRTARETEVEMLQARLDELSAQNDDLVKAAAYRNRLDQSAGAAITMGMGPSDLEPSTPDHSPPASPVKATPRHGALESETLKSSLHHAHKMIQNLKNNIHREKTEKIELKRMLQDARDELEARRADGNSSAAGAGKKRPATNQATFKKPVRINRLGGTKMFENEIINDPAWEEYDTSPIQSRAAASRDLNDIPTDASDAFETANEEEAGTTETEGFQTGLESVPGDSDGDLTETEQSQSEGARMMTLARLTGAGRVQSYQSTASDDVDFFNPSSPPMSRARYKLKMGRSTRPPEDHIDNTHGSPASFSSRITRGEDAYNLAAELEGFGDDDSIIGGNTPAKNHDSTVSTPQTFVRDHTPVSYTPATFVVPIAAEKFDRGTMTEPWIPGTEMPIHSSSIANESEPILDDAEREISHSEPSSTHFVPSDRNDLDAETARLFHLSMKPESSRDVSQPSLEHDGDNAREVSLGLSSLSTQTIEPLSADPQSMSYAYGAFQFVEPITSATMGLVQANSTPSQLTQPETVLPLQHTSILSTLSPSNLSTTRVPLLSAAVPSVPSQSTLTTQAVSTASTLVDPTRARLIQMTRVAPKGLSESYSTRHSITPSPAMDSSISVRAETILPQSVSATTAAAPLQSTATISPPIYDTATMTTLASGDIVRIAGSTPAIFERTISPGIKVNAASRSQPSSSLTTTTSAQLLPHNNSAQLNEASARTESPSSNLFPSVEHPIASSMDFVADLMKHSPSRGVDKHSISESPLRDAIIPAIATPAVQDTQLRAVELPQTIDTIEPEKFAQRAPTLPTMRSSDSELTGSRPASLETMSKHVPDPKMRHREDVRESGSTSIEGNVQETMLHIDSHDESMRRLPSQPVLKNPPTVDRTPLRDASESIMNQPAHNGRDERRKAIILDQSENVTGDTLQRDITPPSKVSTGTELPASVTRNGLLPARFSTDSARFNEAATAGTPDDSSNTDGLSRLPAASMTTLMPPLPVDHKAIITAASRTAGNDAVMATPQMPPSSWRRSSQGRPRTPNSVGQYGVAEIETMPQARAAAYERQEGAQIVSVSSFGSELDLRLKNPTTVHRSNRNVEDIVAPNTDPRMILAITQTMIGEFLWKYTRKTGRDEHSNKRHRRFFWIHPYTRTLYWSNSDPSRAGKTELKAKSVSIEAVRVVSDDSQHPPGLHNKSIVVVTPGRSIKFTSPTAHRHETWFNALSYLLLRNPSVDPVNSMTILDDENRNPVSANTMNPTFSRPVPRRSDTQSSINSDDVAEFNPGARSQSTTSRSIGRKRSALSLGESTTHSRTGGSQPPTNAHRSSSHGPGAEPASRVSYARPSNLRETDLDARFSTPRLSTSNIISEGFKKPEMPASRADVGSPSKRGRVGSITDRLSFFGRGRSKSRQKELTADVSITAGEEGALKTGRRDPSASTTRTARTDLTDGEHGHYHHGHHNNHDQANGHGLENVRACCDGKHDVSSLKHRSYKNRYSSRSRSRTGAASDAASWRSRHSDTASIASERMSALPSMPSLTRDVR